MIAQVHPKIKEFLWKSKPWLHVTDSEESQEVLNEWDLFIKDGFVEVEHDSNPENFVGRLPRMVEDGCTYIGDYVIRRAKFLKKLNDEFFIKAT